MRLEVRFAQTIEDRIAEFLNRSGRDSDSQQVARVRELRASLEAKIDELADAVAAATTT